jgi:hypothetical protein
MPAKRKASAVSTTPAPPVNKMSKTEEVMDPSVAAPSSSAQTTASWQRTISSWSQTQSSLAVTHHTSLWAQTRSAAAQRPSLWAQTASSPAQPASYAAQTQSSSNQSSSSSAQTPSSSAQPRSSSAQQAGGALIILPSAAGLVIPLPSVRPSSRETLPPYKPGLGDTWPKGPDGWRRVLKSYDFYNLLCENTKSAWANAIRLVNECKPGEEINCAFVRGAVPFTKWLHGGWTYQNGDDQKWMKEAEMTPSQIVVEIYRAIRKVGTAPGTTSALELANASLIGKTLSELLGIELGLGGRATGHLLVFCDEMQRSRDHPRAYHIEKAIKLEHLRRPATPDLLAASADPDGIACQLIRLISTDGSDDAYELLNSHGLLRMAYEFGAENVVRALLEHVPVLELDGDAVPTRDPPAGPSQTPIKRLIDAGRELIRVYRRDRSLLLRRTLADRLPFDLFDLIDSYGAGMWHDSAIDMTIESDDDSKALSRLYSRQCYPPVPNPPHYGPLPNPPPSPGIVALAPFDLQNVPVTPGHPSIYPSLSPFFSDSRAI